MTVLQPYIHNGIFDTGKLASVYWIKAKKLYIIDEFHEPCERRFLWDYISQPFRVLKNYNCWLVESPSYQCSHPNFNPNPNNAIENQQTPSLWTMHHYIS